MYDSDVIDVDDAAAGDDDDGECLQRGEEQRGTREQRATLGRWRQSKGLEGVRIRGNNGSNDAETKRVEK